jgi:hypothetical protein
MFGVTYFDNAPEAAMNRSLEEQLTEMGLQKWVTYLRFLKRLTRYGCRTSLSFFFFFLFKVPP